MKSFLAVTALVVATNTNAELISYGLDFTVTDIFAPSGVFDPAPFPGSAVFTIDSNAVDLNPSSPNLGHYAFAGGGTGLSVTFGNLTLFTSSFTVTMGNDLGGTSCNPPPPNTPPIFDSISIVSDLFRTFFVSCNNGLTSDALLPAGDLSKFGPWRGPGFPAMIINEPVRGGGPTPCCWQLTGSSSNLHRIPEPSTLALMLAGFGALGFAIRRREISRT